ncbi:MAG: hypothetical protein DI551_07965 [Micavibrio aeruginosavorus]|uniref:DUF4258 domain-containing protein n=1 Tax=Micavibrio aeruginosavorus TaxID=349221 RepID=A0A2W5N350_9BACT|nr:MAG: hypothetical protein DI551_07965 [Micavibrio aeruginosavorus]
MSRKKRIHVSDHALVRWLERVHGIDVDALRAKMLTSAQIRHIENGASVIKSKGHQYVVENNTIVTVI